ncbi:MAG: UvrD-helicase domain-containing protein [Pseudomonadota bacterium]
MVEIDTIFAIAPENNVIVHAAAGTGKTYLLSNRVIRLLLADCRPGSILGVTFTRKAAGEIHQRVMQRLLDMAGMDEQRLRAELATLGAPADAVTLARARDLYETVLNAIPPLRATTFHAFCQDILRRFPLEAMVPPGFNLLEATREFEQLAWHALDAEITADPANALAQAMDVLLRDSGGYENTRQALMTFLQHRNDWWAYIEGQDDAPAYAAGRLQAALGVVPETDPVALFHIDAAVVVQLDRYARLLARHPTATHEKLVANLAQARLYQTTPDQAFVLVRDAVLTREQQPRALRASKALTGSLGEGGVNELLTLHQQLADRILAVLEQQRRHATLRLARAWYVCGQRLLDHYQRLKEEHGFLDFTDLEWKTCQLLNRSRHAEWVQYKLDQRIDHLLVDEFQDTNPTQWRLLLPLLQEMAAGDPQRRRSVFLVGDEKQSIYRFRRADPDLFRAAHAWLTEHAGARTFGQHTSWRSSPAIIRFVNLVFGGEPDTTYALRAFESHDTRHETMWGRVELLPLVVREHTPVEPPTTLRDPLQTPRIVDEDRRHHREAELIVTRIRSLLGVPIVSRTDGNGEALHRPLAHGDILILLRDRQYAYAYEDALRRADIPYLGSARGQLLARLEIRDLVHLLQLLSAPFDNLALASVLRSPIFSASDADLMQLARGEGPPSWYARLLRLPAAPETPLGRAQQLLPQWMAQVDRIPVHDLLDRIYAESDLPGRYIAAAPKHLRARVEASLTRFLDLALDVDSGRYPSLMRFLARLETLSQDDQETVNEAADNGRQRVRILTIHAAKGLEAPVVFLADSARDTGYRDRGARALIDWPASASRPTHFQLCPRRDALDEVSQHLRTRQEQAAQREETNLLYVALTRARQVLFVSGCESARGNRGWYGFLERRLRETEASGAAAEAGVLLEHIRAPDSEAIYNTCARLEHGQPPVLPASGIVSPPPLPEIDPALRRPIVLAAVRVMERPSEISGEGDRSDEVTVPARDLVLARRRGVAIHRMLELLTVAGTDPEIHARVTHEFPELHSRDILPACWREARAIVEEPAFRFLFDAAHYEDARNEVPILYRDGERDIDGIIDRLVIAHDELVLVDYKTNPQATRGNVPELAQAYTRQMRLYGEGARRLWPGKRLKLLLLFTACRATVEVPPAA